DREAAAEHPAVAAVLVAHAVLALGGGRAALEVVVEQGLSRGEVLGMDAAEPLEGGVADVAVVVAEHRFPAAGIVDLVGLEVPVPEAVVDALGGEAVASLAGPDRLLVLLALGDLDGHAAGEALARAGVDGELQDPPVLAG